MLVDWLLLFLLLSCWLSVMVAVGCDVVDLAVDVVSIVALLAGVGVFGEVFLLPL